MGVNSKFNLLDIEAVDVDSEVIDTAFTRGMSALNALYESIFDATPPGAAARFYAGHDHATGGGSPITRGNVYAEDSGATVLFALIGGDSFPDKDSVNNFVYIQDKNPTYTSANRYKTHLFKFYPSPGFDSGAMLSGWMFYQAINSAFTLQFETSTSTTSRMTELQVNQTSSDLESLSGTWLKIPEVPVISGSENTFNIRVKPLTWQADKKPSFYVYSIMVSEIPGFTHKPSGTRLDR